MRRLHTGVISALALVMGVTATQADAQSLRGFRAEAQGGISSFHSEGNSKSKIGWGGAAGVDAYIANSFVLGAEGTFWWAPAENHTIDGAGLANHKTFEEWGLAARAGVMVTPDTLVYGKVGWVRNEQRKEFVPFLPGTTTPGGAVTPGYYYDHRKVSGITWGGGIEQNITDMFYVKAEGRYSDYRNHTHTLTGLLGVGILVGGTRAESGSTATATATATAAASGDADLPGWQRDPGDRRLPGSATSATSAASAGATRRTRLSIVTLAWIGADLRVRPFFLAQRLRPGKSRAANRRVKRWNIEGKSYNVKHDDRTAGQMGSRIAPFMLICAALTPADASDMSSRDRAARGNCHVVGGEKLPATLAGGTAICAELQRAVAIAAPAARYSAEVRVLSRTRLAAALTVNGRALPEQKFAIMDRELDAGAIQRFAHSLAAEIAKAPKS